MRPPPHSPAQPVRIRRTCETVEGRVFGVCPHTVDAPEGVAVLPQTSFMHVCVLAMLARTETIENIKDVPGLSDVVVGQCRIGSVR